MKKFPNKTKFTRPHKIKVIKGTKGFSLSRYTVGVRIKSSRYLSYEHLETARRAISRVIKPKELKKKKNSHLVKSTQTKVNRGTRRPKAKQKKFLNIRSNLCLPLTKKPLQVRMGKGKGAIDRWVYPANKSRVIFEISRQRLKLRKTQKALTNTCKKMPIKLKFTYHRFYLRRESNFTESKK